MKVPSVESLCSAFCLSESDATALRRRMLEATDKRDARAVLDSLDWIESRRTKGEVVWGNVADPYLATLAFTFDLWGRVTGWRITSAANETGADPSGYTCWNVDPRRDEPRPEEMLGA